MNQKLEFNTFLTSIDKTGYVRTWIVAICLCVFCFVVPLQCYIIGNDYGLGVQGAVFRYQMAVEGNSLIPLTHEIEYITSGIYTGRAALSVILWALGTITLVLTTILSLIGWNKISVQHFRYIIIGIEGSCILYLASCVARYGLLFFGPAGICLPIGVIMLAIMGTFLYFYQGLFIDLDPISDPR